MQIVKKSMSWGEHTLTIETGRIARQATGSVLVSLGDTAVLVTAVALPDPAGELRDFFPLRVDYQERGYAVGKIPGGFFKREGKPSERETLISRLIDRPIRPLFHEHFTSEVQIIATVLSLNPEIDSDVPALIGASAALALSGVPFQGPVGAARVGYAQGRFLLNPSRTEQKDSELDLVVAGTRTSVLMVESEAKELPESVMLEAVQFGHRAFAGVLDLIESLKAEAGKPHWEWSDLSADPTYKALKQRVEALAGDALQKAFQIRTKGERVQELARIRSMLKTNLTSREDGSSVPAPYLSKICHDLEASIVRRALLQGEARIDGRDLKTVRPIQIETSWLPRVHGSALFTRGETQALVAVTLGTGRDAQVIDSPLGEYRDRFMLHYNFPPYSVGEVGLVGSPKRREIGHGRLARRAIQGVLPSESEFPYVLRVVSEIAESNGSSSMATVCGTSLACMDAGVPLKAPVAGIAMGLIKEGEEFVILTDILGDEDHLGDMDFKVAGTEKGVTALQMDIKMAGITPDVMQQALAQAKEGRLHILRQMNDQLPIARQQVSDFAPRITTFKIHTDKIREVIGKGGVTIRSITEETGAVIEITDDGTVSIAAVDKVAGDEARRRIEAIVAEAELGCVYLGKVVRIVDFGAFVNFLSGKEGLLHISQISHQRIGAVTDVLQEGQLVNVKVIEIDRQGRIRLSMKDVEPVLQ